MNLAKNLQKLLRNRNLKVSELARATQVPAQTLNNWLSNQKPRSMEQVYQVARYFEISIEELCFGRPPVRQNPIDFYLQDEVYAGMFEVVLKKASSEDSSKKRLQSLSVDLRNFVNKPNLEQKDLILKKLKAEVARLKEITEVPQQLKTIMQALEILIAQVEGYSSRI